MHGSAAPPKGAIEAWVKLDPGAKLPETNRDDNVAFTTGPMWETRWGNPTDNRLRLSYFNIGTAAGRGRNFLRRLEFYFPVSPNQVDARWDATEVQPGPVANDGERLKCSGRPDERPGVLLLLHVDPARGCA